MSTINTKPGQPYARRRTLRPLREVETRGPGLGSTQDSGAETVGVVGLSLVIPIYDVERYLPELLDSIASQAPGRYALQCVFIDDGSPDRSADLVEQWIDGAKPAGVDAMLIRQPNAGVSAARNRGISAAKNEWIAFPDSDDALDARYCAEVAEFLLENGATSTIVATNVLKYLEAEGVLDDSHALRFKFQDGAQNVDLRTSPHYIQIHAGSAFFRRAEIVANGVRFIEGLHASEDSIFVAEMLSASPRPVLGLVPGAIFRYRKRASGDSAVDLYHTNPSTYFDRFERGYLPLLARLADDGAGVPDWLANHMMYELKWLFVAEHKRETKALLLTPEQKDAFLRLVSDVLSYIDDRIILGFRATPLSMEIRHLLLALKGSPLPEPRVHLAEFDARRRMVQVRYVFTGELPDEEFTVGGRIVEPLYSKVRRPDYFDQQALRERRAWLPATGLLAVRLDGRPQELQLGWLAGRPITFSEKQIWEHFARSAPARQVRSGAITVPPSGLLAQGLRMLRPHLDRATTSLAAARATWGRRLRPASVARYARRQVWRSLAYSPVAARRYRNAWVLMDRIDAAQDNAEHLYRHIQQQHPTTNLWFVLDRGSADWRRLRSEGFRLVPYRSGKHLRIMAHARHLISSHIDVEVVSPVPKGYGKVGNWSFTFLQHGVTKEDISHWTNNKKISRFITAARPEFDSIAGDDNAYRVTSKEVALTGFPRFDRLHRLSSDSDKRILLVAPTWRESLMEPKVHFQKRRPLRPDFASSDYARNWFGLLHDPAFARLAQEAALQIVLLPHPMFANTIDPDDLPEWVTLRKYGEGDAQALLAGARVMITDYSSTAFDVAFAGGDVVYFQFDRDAALNGGHRAPGYFDYERDGFGPVGLDRSGVLHGLRSVLADGRAAYADRVAVFPHRDDGSCERVYRSIVELDVPALAP